MAADDQVTVDVGFTGDPSSLSRLEATLAATFDTLAARLGDTLEKGFKEAFKSVAVAADKMQLGKTIDEQLTVGKKSVHQIVEELANAKVAASQVRFDAGHTLQDAAKDAEVLSKRIEAVRSDAQRIELIDPAQFAVLDRTQEKLLTLSRNIREALTNGVASPELRRQFQSEFEALSRIAVSESKNIQSALRTANASANRDTREAVNVQAQAARENLVTLRNEGTERSRALRTAGELQLAQEKASGKARVANLQTIGRLLVDVERGIGKSLAAAARVGVSGLARLYSDTFGQIPGLIRRTGEEQVVAQKEVDQRIEREIQRSTTERTTTIREGLTRQQALAEKASVTASTGVTGLATGRSNLANAVGFGGLIGGGFAIFSALKSGIVDAQDFDQTMKVLQTQLGLTDAQMKAVSETSVQLGNDLSLPGVSAKDAGDAINILTRQFGSLGKGAVDAATKAAKGTLQLARATGASADDAAALIGSAVNVFGIGADKAVSVADAITGALAKAAGVSFTDFKDSFVQGATVFEQFVGPAEDANNVLIDFNTTLAILAKNGITGSTAGAGLKQFFLQANKSGKESVATQKELTKRAGETGTVFFDSAGKARNYSDSLAIIRKGVVGYTDAQRVSTLSTLFGARSITIANALIRTSQADYDKLRASIQQQGIAARVAAAQNQGLRGAMDALSSVIDTQILLAFQKLDKPLGNAVVKIAEFVNKLASGTGIYSVVRDGLKGIAIALGGLLIIKTVAEGFQLLALALGAVLSPIGILIVAVASAGALISILEKRSASFRETMDKLRDTVGKLASKLADLVGEQLKKFADFMERTGIPALEKFGKAAVEKIGDAIRVVQGFATGTAIPFLKNLADTLFDLATRGFGALSRVLHDIQPVLKPVITFLSGLAPLLGSAIGNVFAGKFADAFGDLQQVGSKIKTAFTPIIKNIGDFFVEQFNNAKEAIKKINWADVGTSILDAVKFVGRQIGNILTDPKTLGIVGGAAAALVAAAVLVGANFIAGVVQGIQSNIPALTRDIKNIFIPAGEAILAGLLAGLKAAFNSPEVILAVIAGVGLRNAIKARFQETGKQAASSFGTGLSSLGRVKGAGFVDALIGTDASTIFDRRTEALRTAANRKIDAINRVYKASGTALVENLVPGQTAGQITSRLNGITKDFQNFQTNVGSAASKGFNLRAQISSGLNFKKIADDLRLQGKDVGTAFATAAVAAIGAVFAGVALGKGDVVGGIAGIVTAGITAGIATGSPEVGVAVAAVGALTAVFTAHAEAAKRARAEIKEYTDAVKDATTAADVMQGVLKTLNSELGQQSSGTLKALAGIGFSTDALAKAAANGKSAVTDFFNTAVGPQVLDRFPALKAGFDELGISIDDFGKLAAKGQLDKVLGAITVTGGAPLKELKSQLKDAGLTVDDLADAFKFMSGEANQALKGIDNADLIKSISAVKVGLEGMSEEAKKEVVTKVLQGAEQAAKDTAAAFDVAAAALQNLIDPRQNTLAQSIDQAIVSASNFGTTLSESIKTGTTFGASQVRLQFDDLSKQVGDLLTKGIKDGTITDKASAEKALKPFQDAVLSTVKDPLIKGAITNTFNAGFENIDTTVAAKKANDAATTAKTAIDKAFAGGTPAEVPVNLKPPTASEAADLASTVGASIPSVQVPIKLTAASLQDAHATGLASASALEKELNATVKVNVAPPSPAETAKVGADAAGQVVSSFGGKVKEVASQATAAVAAAGPPSKITGGIVGIGAGAGFGGGVAGGIKASAGQVRSQATTLIADAARSAGNNAFDKGENIGQELAAGIAVGINRNTASAASQAVAAANAIVAATKQALKIKSPSQVFADIGKQISLGLAKGIGDGSEDVAAAVQGVIESVVAAASGATNIARAGAQQIRASLFDLLFNQQVTVKLAIDTEQAKEALATGIFGLQDQVKSAADAKLKAQIDQAFGHGAPLSAEDRAALAVNPNSLALDRQGIQNRSAIAAQVAQIKDFGAALIDSGVSAASAVAQMKAYRNQLILQAVHLGFNQKQISQLVTTLGLGDAALANFVTQVTNASKGLTTATAAAAKAAEQTAKFQAFTESVKNGEFNLSDTTTVTGATGAATRRGGNVNPVVGVLNVNLPTGDPHANALEVANRLAMIGAV